VYGALFGIGKLVFGEWLTGTLLLLAAVIAGLLIWRHLESRGWETLSGGVPKTEVPQTVER
jgi:hypothetical protein